MTDGIRGNRRHVAEQQREEERSQAPPEESMDEVATRIPKEVGRAGARLRRGAARFGREPPPDEGGKASDAGDEVPHAGDELPDTGDEDAAGREGDAP
ncbi:hypothetical protein ACIGN6_16890 [Streptomyces sp. NPDC053792]|uniref:hypothetical protein n=1 Tax=unclassified Streptomyces TaxID=2593676 RepID=UPI0034414AA5